MADNVRLDDNTTSGALVRTVEKSSKQVPVSVLDVGTHPNDNTGTESLVSKTTGVGMPVEGLANDNVNPQGAPVLSGGAYISNPGSLTEGRAGHLLLDQKRNLRAAIYGGSDQNTPLAIDAAGGITVSNAIVTDFDTAASDPELPSEISNGLAFGIAIPSSGGPEIVGEGNTTLPISGSVSVTNSTLSVTGSIISLGVGTNGGNDVIGTVKLPADETILLQGSDHAQSNPQSHTLKVDSSGTAFVSSVVTSAPTIQGKDGSTARDITVDSDGHLQVDIQSNVSLGVNNPVSLQIGSTALTSTQVNSDQCLDVFVQGGVSGTEYTEDEASEANPVGGASILVRADASSGALAGSLVNANGDNVAQRGTNYGSSYVTTVSSDGKVGVLEGWDYALSNPAAHKVKVDAQGHLQVDVMGGGVLAQGNVYFYDRTYGSTNLGSNAQYNAVDSTSNGNLVLASDYEVGRTGTLDNLGITNSEPRVSLSGAIIDSTLEDLTDSGGANHTDGDAVQLRVNNNGKLYVDVGNIALGASNQNIGNVDVSSLPALPAGSNDIGNVTIGKGNGCESNFDAIISTAAGRMVYSNAQGVLQSPTAITLHSLTAINLSSSVLYLFLIDSASSPTFGSGSSSQVKGVYAIPCSATGNGAGLTVNVANGINIHQACYYFVRTSPAWSSSNTSGPSSGEFILNYAFTDHS